MSGTWTAETILALAPDSASAKSGRDLAAVRKWVTLGHADTAAWGECQGSGKNPYQTRIDLSEPAFKCSCPSRKFPCKHSLGLFLLLVAQPAAFGQKDVPPWVTEWLEGRAGRSEKKAKKAEEAKKPADPVAQAKRLAERQAKVSGGLGELERWVGDLIRRGLAAAQTQPHGYWESIAARMVDAQAPGLARWLRDLAGLPAGGDGWPGRLLARVARIHLLLQGYQKLEVLPPETQADLKSLVGWAQNQDELLASGEAVEDRWLVVGQKIEEEDQLRTQRTWLWGVQHRRAALVLQFAHVSQPLENTLIPGGGIAGGLVFFPGGYPLRALVRNKTSTPLSAREVDGFATVREALTGFAAALATNPWVERFPMLFDGVTPLKTAQTWVIEDAAGERLPISPRFERGWSLLAASGGKPIAVFGEWDGGFLSPMAAWSDGRFVSC